MRSGVKWGCVLVAVLATLPFVLRNDFLMDVAIRIALNALVAIALNLLIGYAGQISLGHAAFFAMGAYGSAILSSRYGWSPLAAMGASAAAAGLLAVLISRPIFSLRGHYLAMATLGLGSLVHIIAVNEIDWTGGPDGMAVPALEVLGWVVDSPMKWYALSASLLVLVTFMAASVATAPYGRALQAIHGSEAAARAGGINVASTKMNVFAFSAVVTSLAGSLVAHYVGFITPGVASFLHSIEMVTMVVIGGMASVAGSIVGAALITLLPQLLSTLEGWETVAFGAILMLGMILMPRGIVPSLLLKVRS